MSFQDETTSRLCSFSRPTCDREPPARNSGRNRHYSSECWVGGKPHCFMHSSFNAVHWDMHFLSVGSWSRSSAISVRIKGTQRHLLPPQSQSIMLLRIRPIDPKMGASLFIFALRQNPHTLLMFRMWKPRSHNHAACLYLSHFALPQIRRNLFLHLSC